MRGSPESMTYLRARTPEEAVKTAAARPEARPLAGGTDLMVSWNAGH